MKAQDAAKQQITSAVGTLTNIQSKVNSGEKLTSAEQKVAERVNDVLSKGAGTDSKALGALIDAGSKMLGKLNSDMPAEFGGTHRSGWTAEALPHEVKLYSSFFRQTAHGQAQITAHESHHHAVGGLDIGMYYGREYINPYGYAAALRRAQVLRNPKSILRLPDPTTYALGFQDEIVP